ncbi:MAG TPA: diguanylate cyclase [Conexibacter sp.]|jgi:GGDEF domain-containing protein
MTDSRTPRPHRPEPLAWGTVEPLTGRAQTIAKGWLLHLLERAPLDTVGTIPAAALAAEGPGLCAAVVRCLASDYELERLRPAGDLAPLARRVGELAGARDAVATVAAVEALRACLWSAALDELGPRADVDSVRALAGRLAEVAAVITATALEAGAGDAWRAREAAPVETERRGPDAGGVVGDPPAPAELHDPPAAGFAAGMRPAPAAGGSERADTPSYGPHAPTLDDLRGEDDDGPVEHHSVVSQLPQRPDAGPAATAEMEDGDLWIATLERHIDRCKREGGPLALLRVELVDGDRVAASAGDEDAHVPYGKLAQAVRRAIRRQDLVASDHQGRAWVIAPGVGRAGAIALAERIGAGVEEGEGWRGAPLSATIGFAVYGEDGSDAVALIDRAEEAMLAAEAAGARIGEAVPAPEGDPSRSGPRLVR